MAATAITQGPGDWGIESAETGLIVSSISYSYAHNQESLEDISGNTICITQFDEKVEITIEAQVPATSPFTGALAEELTLSNSIPDHLNGGVTGGSIITDSIDLTHDRKAYKSISIKAVYYPNISLA